ncbi:SAE2-domain-containing protein [Xylona heveae TC161]|uniref:SAE2-domain-containing protein n=1 Tax=Xylona heveae (strain CBS 132557 / TC161) TaxID=1328760 RepID=A0A165F8Q7_XYLHT|nr:SAE2-domain-containing protein [Xylona heveae TC161]KZF20711.1 SAE2-domain-containing protein [Xylona heveae TC161]
MDKFERHRSSLFDTFTEKFDQLWTELQNEITIRKENEKQLFNEVHMLKYNNPEVKRLRDENSRLEAQLEDISLRDPPGREQSETRHAGSETRPSEQCSCTASKDLSRLAENYNHLSSKYATVFEAYKVLRFHWDEQKQNRDQWKAYAKWHSEHTAKKRNRSTVGRNSEPSPAGSTAMQGPMLNPPPAVDDIPLPLSPHQSPMPQISHLNYPQGWSQSIEGKECTPRTGRQMHNEVDGLPFYEDENGRNQSRPYGVSTFFHDEAPKRPYGQSLSSNGIDREAPISGTKSSKNVEGMGQRRAGLIQGAAEDLALESGGNEHAKCPPNQINPPSSNLSFDEPVFVSERRVKRKRETEKDRSISTYCWQADEVFSPQRQRIKHEQESSSPVDLDNILPVVVEPESLDLDEIGQKINTPKKPRKSFPSSQASRSLRNRVPHHLGMQRASNLEDLQRAIKIEPTQNDYTSQQLDSKQLFQDEGQFYDNLTGSRAPDATIDQENLGLRSRSEPPTSSQLQQSQQNQRRERSFDSPLVQKSANIRALPRTSNPNHTHSTKSRKKDGSSSSLRVAVMAEDGEQNMTPERPPSLVEKHNSSIHSNKLNVSGMKPFTYQRLGDLLDDRTPSKKVLLQNGIHARSSRSTRTPKRQPESLFDNQASGNVATAGIAEQDNPDNEPFRSRGIHRLGLEHFKINPNNNQGLEYAFTETIRNREQRSCLPGCTKPECCGNQFRKLVEIAGYSMSADEEQLLLEDYLGNDSVRLNRMGQKERQELLVQVKAKLLADKHGKHRQPFERRATPPGFWRTDMPTTQELEQDREKARRLERDKIEERYMEAMRPGGRFMFRDEEP